MRTLLVCCFLLFFLSSCPPQKPEEAVFLFSYFTGRGEDGLHFAYSEDGLTWKAVKDSSYLKPQLGKEKLMRDPNITLGKDGNYHMVWTVGWNEKGIGYAHSKDLLNWSNQQYLPVMEQEPDARNCWAPEITYDDSSDQYYIYWATTISGKFPETDSTAENNYNHRMYYVTTANFQEFSETRLLYDAGFNVIDATIIKDGDQFVMFIKNETLKPEAEKNLRVVSGPTITGPYSTPSPAITGDYWAEGPTAIRIGFDWVVFFDKYRNHKMGAVRSSDLKNWTDISDQISFPKGVRHGTALQVPKSVLQKLLSD